MTTGELTERVAVLRKTTTSDGQGGRGTTWPTVRTVWACVTPLSAQEQLQAGTIGARLHYRVTMRHREDLTTAMRLQWRPYQATTMKTFEIHGIQIAGRDRTFVTLDCSEVL